MSITCIEDYYTYRQHQEDVFVTSKRHGKVLVPCMNTLLVAPGLVVANTYNPNRVPNEKMELLRQSILDNGFCFPIVTIFDEDTEQFVIIDGFHRFLIGNKEWLDFDFIPIVILKHDITRRMIATKQFNAARGLHQVDLDAEIVRALLQQGLTEEEISTHLKMDDDTIFRYKQVAGVASLFAHVEYSMSWEIMEEDES